MFVHKMPPRTLVHEFQSSYYLNGGVAIAILRLQIWMVNLSSFTLMVLCNQFENSAITR